MQNGEINNVTFVAFWRLLTSRLYQVGLPAATLGEAEVAFDAALEAAVRHVHNARQTGQATA